MTKAVVQVGYKHYVMDAHEALTFLEILAKAERYKRDWRSKDEGGVAYYIWEQDEETETTSLELIPDGLYRMAKLAGKPDQNS